MAKKKTDIAVEEVAVEEIVEESAHVKEVKAPDVLMYVGPTVRGFATQNCVYEGIPADAIDKFKDEPELQNLFIPITEYPKALKMLRTGKGYIFSAYTKALLLKGGKRE